jgi:hypothetical protein
VSFYRALRSSRENKTLPVQRGIYYWQIENKYYITKRHISVCDKHKCYGKKMHIFIDHSTQVSLCQEHIINASNPLKILNFLRTYWSVLRSYNWIMAAMQIVMEMCKQITANCLYQSIIPCVCSWNVY